MTTAGPWLPWPLSRWRWFTAPVPAERLAALRIGLAAVLLVDILWTYLPGRLDFYGTEGVAGPIRRNASLGIGPAWSLFSDESPALVLVALTLWAFAALGLLLGFRSRTCAATAWAMGMSFHTLNPWIENAGDSVRSIALLYLALSPCGAAWALDARGERGVEVHPWPIRLLTLQMMAIYFVNGLHKAVGIDWPEGRSIYHVMADFSLTRWSSAQWQLPYPLTRLMTWAVLVWELCFPALMLSRWTRPATLCVGVLFHVGLLVVLELGLFPLYMLCLYLPFVPWERFDSTNSLTGRSDLC